MDTSRYSLRYCCSIHFSLGCLELHILNNYDKWAAWRHGATDLSGTFCVNLIQVSLSTLQYASPTNHHSSFLSEVGTFGVWTMFWRCLLTRQHVKHRNLASKIMKYVKIFELSTDVKSPALVLIIIKQNHIKRKHRSKTKSCGLWLSQEAYSQLWEHCVSRKKHNIESLDFMHTFSLYTADIPHPFFNFMLTH